MGIRRYDDPVTPGNPTYAASEMFYASAAVDMRGTTASKTTIATTLEISKIGTERT